MRRHPPLDFRGEAHEKQRWPGTPAPHSKQSESRCWCNSGGSRKGMSREPTATAVIADFDTLQDALEEDGETKSSQARGNTAPQPPQSVSSHDQLRRDDGSIPWTSGAKKPMENSAGRGPPAPASQPRLRPPTKDALALKAACITEVGATMASRTAHDQQTGQT